MFYRTVLLAVIPLISLAEANKTIPQDCADPYEIFSAYGGSCEPTCQNPELKKTENCKAACTCSNGYVRDKFSGKCINKEHCCLNQYEVYNDCGSACESTCESPRPRLCTAECKTGCFCSNGTIRNIATGKCVNISNCTCKSENKEFSECGSSCPRTCRNKPVMCTMDCRPGCFCKEGMVIDDTTGKCVKVKDCTCPTEDEVFRECGTLCPKTCSDPDPKMCPDVCTHGCFCKDENKVRDENTWKCVDIEQCPINREQRPCKDENEEYQTCASACQPNCTHPETPIACTKQCAFGCFCKNGTIRDTETGKCVPPKDCFSESKARCKKNEVYRYGPVLEKSCANPNIEKKVEHANHCYCKEGYFRNEKTGECVLLNNCCNCKDHEVFSKCVSIGGVCKNTCSSPNKSQNCFARCAPGCKCKEGFLLDDNTRKCIPPSLCRKKAADTECVYPNAHHCTCPEDEVFGCLNSCTKTCSNFQHREPCDDICRIGCVCKDRNKIRDEHTGKCVNIEECNRCKNENEEFQTCGTACQPTCTNPNPFCSLQCVVGCFCTNGTVRDEKTGRCVLLQDC